MKLIAPLFSALILLSLLFTPQAWSQSRERSARPMTYSSSTAGVLLDVGIYYGQSEATANPSLGNEWKDNTSVYDVKLGYIGQSGIYLGAEYSTRTLSASSINVSSSTGSTAAAGLGYFFDNGFNLRAYYRVNETFGDYKSGSGFQGDLGFMLNMSSNFYMGFLISHRQVTFSENRTIVGFDTWTRKETYPFITLALLLK